MLAPGLNLGLARRLPLLGGCRPFPAARAGEGMNVDRKLWADRWVPGAWGRRPGGGW